MTKNHKNEKNSLQKFFGVSFDSMQIYRGLNIGTAKPTDSEQAEIRHHLIDICDPGESFSAADFAKRAHETIADIRSRGKKVVLCGGTGLYLDSVIGRLDFGEIESDDKLREELFGFAEKNGVDALLMERGVTPMLYADAAYPASNRVYQKIGFEKIGEISNFSWKTAE